LQDRIELIGERRDLDSLATAWDALADRAGHPFARHAWLCAWLDAFAPGRDLAVFTAWRGDWLAGVLPTIADGGLLAAPTNAHTPWFSTLGDAQAIGALGDALARSPASHVVLGELALDDPTVDVLRDALDARRPLTWIEPRRHAPVVEPQESRRVGSLSGRRTKELRRLARRLEHDVGARVESLAQPVELEQELEQALAVEASGWKGRRGTAILDDDPTDRFYREMARAFHARGELRFSRITARERLVAFDLCLVSHGRVWIPKGSIDEEFGRFSPGRVLLLAEIEAAFASGLDGVELLGDAEPYKLPFATRVRPHGALHGARLRPLPLARIAYRRAAYPLLRKAAQRLRSR